ncbi:M15 family metallopeptidase [Pasteurellaceae bacterium HPA106]|uniref:M15 family metallopeptidase n=1 Tax=Spirabiliibacterium pneumoniae TaxID=221400 RepID=UPI001AAD55EE|nr:M15 family metallopeptidase [Spirabiliibacterium pneumoniae]MBE2897130.1 M15 family metallopeptidase [Spirabiliibacterium pneumoniae]
MNFTSEMLTGQTQAHLVPLPSPYASHHKLHRETLSAFQGLQQSAVKAGFDLQPASSFRDFERQRLIWNGKMSGERKVHDDNGCALDFRGCDEWQKIQAILRWSAMPGASRHHWGSEIDFYDPTRLPAGQALQLEPWEYQAGGYFADLSAWLMDALPHFDFYLPFMQNSSKAIGCEPWHISHRAVAECAARQFTPDVLIKSWQHAQVLGKAILCQHLDDIFVQFIL